MAKVRMRAIDTLHISALGADNIAPGEEFSVSSAIAQDLEQRGLAKRVGKAKAEPAPANKAQGAAPANKAAIPPIGAKGVTQQRTSS